MQGTASFHMRPISGRTGCKKKQSSPEIYVYNTGEKWSDIRLDFSAGPFCFDCSRNFGGRHDFDPSRDNHRTHRGIPCGEHTYPAIGARSCAFDGACAVRCPVVTAHMYNGCDEILRHQHKFAQASLTWMASAKGRRHCLSPHVDTIDIRTPMVLFNSLQVKTADRALVP